MDICGAPHYVDQAEQIGEILSPLGDKKHKVYGTPVLVVLQVDGRDVLCQLAKGHGGYLHAWSHRLHTDTAGHGTICWPTEDGAKALAGGVVSKAQLHGAHARAMRLELNGRSR